MYSYLPDNEPDGRTLLSSYGGVYLIISVEKHHRLAFVFNVLPEIITYEQCVYKSISHN